MDLTSTRIDSLLCIGCDMYVSLVAFGPRRSNKIELSQERVMTIVIFLDTVQDGDGGSIVFSKVVHNLLIARIVFFK
jgi:hypothetical protein